MRKSSADVIVVGAGPAGAVTALLLARAGRDVLILDRAAFPRAKPCGDCLSLGAAAQLHRIGVLESVLSAPHAQLVGWRIVAPDGSAFTARFRDAVHVMKVLPHGRLADCALAVERAVLDDVLLRAALAAGARFERAAVTDLVRDGRGCIIGVRTRSHSHYARITVGADGLRSVVAARLGARTAPRPLHKLSLTYHLDLEVAATGEMHSGDGICAGLAPVDADGRCNLTLVVDAHRFGRDVARDARAFSCAALDTLPLLRGRVPAAALGCAAPLASGPFHRPVRRVAFAGAVLVGDAAGYYDPFTGQGVFQAIASAEALAPGIDHALTHGHPGAAAFNDYVRARTALLRGPRLVQRGIESVLSRPALANRAIARIATAPAFARVLLAVTGDTAPASALLSPHVLSSLLHPTQPECAA